MNCNFHPDVPSVAFCQFCGKPLCKGCVRNVGGSVFCEACLAERLRATGAADMGVPAAIFTGTPHPMLGGLLGIIPGVGAMYNGQYAKAIAHVVIFAVLVSLSDHIGVFGILVAAWVVYQVFDAYQTALARRDGLPLPNPFGLNDIAQRMGIHPSTWGVHPSTWGVHPNTWTGTTPPVPPPVPPVPPAGDTGWQPVSGAGQPGQPYAGFAPGGAPGYPPAPGQPGYAEWLGNDIRQRSGAGQQGYGYVPGQPYAPVPPPPPFPPSPYPSRDIPVGAIILIGLGILFLFGSLGLFHEDWVAHGWPLLIIGLGLWIIYRRTHAVPPPMPIPPGDPSSIHSPGHSHSVPTDTTTGGAR